MRRSNPNPNPNPNPHPRPAQVTQLRKGADAAESALKELVQQRQARGL